ncbi:hypothetical protein AVEN_95285-1 [Araneus ventricosus]|uniref:Uncharacterized protein n=1 Tax=Araneus ventricosus TaxID=182803 RepID=A0A4Y2RRU7_ARAVE|nr:hypothetical protein AVEN_177376-1 [Araneus ventricosus]GBN78428.1 hypothetical protein AVEN_95285-1 [Araneus ventricosus]
MNSAGVALESARCLNCQGAIQELCSKRSHSFDYRSENEDNTIAGIPFQKFSTKSVEGRLTPMDLTIFRPKYTPEIWWNQDRESMTFQF